MFRRFTTKADIKLISQLRKQTECSIVKAKEVLLKTNNDYNAALALLNAPTDVSKYKNRESNQGMIGIYNHPSGYFSSMVKLGCETDFVAKNPSFVSLLDAICLTLALKGHIKSPTNIAELDLVPSLQETVVSNTGEFTSTIIDEIAKLTSKFKENINLKEAYMANQPSTVSSAYCHSSIPNLPKGIGNIGTIVSIEHENKLLSIEDRTLLVQFTQKLAQHCCGLNPTDLNDLKSQDYLFGTQNVQNEIGQLQEKLKVGLNLKDFKYITI